MTAAKNVATMLSVAKSLQTCNVGMSCEDYTLLIIAGPYSKKDLPPAVRERIDQHLEACAYHNSRGFHQSAIDTPVTPAMEEAALEIVEKYNH